MIQQITLIKNDKSIVLFIDINKVIVRQFR